MVSLAQGAELAARKRSVNGTARGAKRLLAARKRVEGVGVGIGLGSGDSAPVWVGEVNASAICVSGLVFKHFAAAHARTRAALVPRRIASRCVLVFGPWWVSRRGQLRSSAR
jgi:hypothetical protein